MKKSAVISITIIFLLLFSTNCKNKEDKPETDKKTGYSIMQKDDVPDFSGKNALDYVFKQVEFGPRNPNSKGHKAALEYLSKELAQYTDTLILQAFTYTGYNDEKLFLTNIIGKINPQASNRILLCAHWDTRPMADQDPDPAKRDLPILGANDGGSGVAVLLETAKILKEKKPLFGVDIILFDGEDYGKASDISNFCIGSKYFAAKKSRDYNPEIGILLDLIGDKEAKLFKEANSTAINKRLVDEIWKIAARKGYKKFIDQTGSAIYDDHIPLSEAGIMTINIIDSELVGGHASDLRRNYWHTHKDTPDNLSAETLGEVGTVLINLIYSIQFNK
ncbi:MAG: M28 family peptidase [Ignavibacteria bacterium]|nr:M28 family peptidase [Ignavibacteria bacterium]